MVKSIDKHRKLATRLLHEVAPRPEDVIIQLADGLRTSFRADSTLFLADRFSNRVRADMDWFEHVIRHQPTVGAFYEILLRNSLTELAPTSCSVGTGFVLDPVRPIHSKQLDIIVSDTLNSSPVFKNGELVVVRPSSVISVCDVKKTLRLSDVHEIIDGTLFSNLGTRGRNLDGLADVQDVNIFGFASSLNIRSLAKSVRDYLNTKLWYTRVRVKRTRRIGYLKLESLVLPSIFLFNSSEYIRCSLKQHAHPSRFSIEVRVYESREIGGCMGVFLLSCLPMLRGEQSAFISSPLEAIIDRWETRKTILLHSAVPMHEIEEHFGEDRAAIRNFSLTDGKPHKVHVPKGLKWQSLSKFDEFVAAVGPDAFQVNSDA